MSAWPDRVRRLILDEIDSTNAEAARQATLDPSPLWVMARRQSAGRGRQGRAWHAPEGNLMASLLMPFEGGPGEAATTFAQTAALAVHETCAAFAPMAEIRIKWPNDILVNRRKAAGILIENLGPGPDGRLRIVTGIGLNLSHAPPAEETRWPATSLAAEGATAPSPDDALEILAQSFATWLARPAPQRQTAWRDRLHGIGDPMEARLPAETLAGIFDGVDETGALVLRTPHGVRHIPAADVYFPEA
ncbi:MAG: biotin--[acetyl-CoA-carboxylase] ligase [Pseudomonadota bacterium]